MTVVIVAVAGWALFGSHFLVVRSIQVNGTSSPVTRAQVLAAGRIPLGTPLIRVNPGDVARRIERIRQVQSAEVSRDWPDSVAITIRLRAPVFAMAAPGGYALVDSSGVVLRSSATRPRGFPLLVLGGAPGPAGGQPRIRAAAMVLHELPRWITRQVVGVRAAAPADLSLLLANGAVIVWGDPSRPGEKAQELAVLLHTRARLYDVSGPGTAVTRG